MTGQPRVRHAARRTAVSAVLVALLLAVATTGTSIARGASAQVPALRVTEVGGVGAPARMQPRTVRPPEPTAEQRRAVNMPGVRLGGSTPNVLGTSSAAQQFVVQVRDQGTLDLAIATLDAAPADVWNTGLLGFSADLDAVHVARLQGLPGVVAVEPDGRVAGSTDEVNPPWGLDRVDQHRRPLDSLYTYTSTGAGVTAYVIDSGLWFSHVEFTGRVPAYAYWDFGDGTGAWDCDGHGTHVAGTIGGTTYGVAKQVSIVPVKVLDCDGAGTTASIVSGINWVIADHVAGAPAVANMSLGGLPSIVVDAAVQALIADGVTVVVAAGNDAAPSCNYSPARVPQAITVAASDSTDDDAPFSNYGACNDLFAPGVGILSAFPPSDTGSATLSGTSMAAPHVSGAAALLLQQTPAATPAQVWAVLDAASTRGVLSECCGDPDELLYTGPVDGVPGAPTAVTGVIGNGQVAVSWVAPVSDGGSSITGYTATSHPAGRTCTTAGSSCAVPGLSNGTAYTFTVAATNGFGAGPPSVASPAYVPSTVPGPPTGVAAVVGDGQIGLSWSAPADNGGSAIGRYTATSNPAGRTCTTAGTSCVIAGLVNGTAFTFTVVATNGVGPGPASGPSAPSTPTAPPEPPLPSGATQYAPVTPVRLADTRPQSPTGLWSQIDTCTIRVPVADREGVPADATAAALTITMDHPAADGWAAVYPAGAAFGGISNVNFKAGEIRANSAIVQLGTGAVDIKLYAGACGSPIVIDVTGAFVPTTTGVGVGRFVRTAGQRVSDSRNTGGALPAGTISTFTPAALGIPTDATAVVLNVTVADTGGAGFVAGYPTGRGRGLASMLNADGPNEIRAGFTIVPISASGLSIYQYMQANLLIDVVGYMSGTPTAGGAYVPAVPARILDTRPAHLASLETTTLTAPPDARAIVANWTIAESTSAGWIAVRPSSATGVAATSTVNASTAADDVANLAITPTDPGGVTAQVGYTSAAVIADYAGYFTA